MNRRSFIATSVAGIAAVLTGKSVTAVAEPSMTITTKPNSFEITWVACREREKEIRDTLGQYGIFAYGQSDISDQVGTFSITFLRRPYWRSPGNWVGYREIEFARYGDLVTFNPSTRRVCIDRMWHPAVKPISPSYICVEIDRRKRWIRTYG